MMNDGLDKINFHCHDNDNLVSWAGRMPMIRLTGKTFLMKNMMLLDDIVNDNHDRLWRAGSFVERGSCSTGRRQSR